MRSRQLALDLNGDGSEGPIPVVYLACRLTASPTTNGSCSTAGALTSKR